jgi:glycosyltransferase involved in cell wall biosynthesis
MEKLSIIFGYRNRDIQRVERCLNSLKDQTYSNFEVIFVDYGSDENYQLEVKNLLGQYQFVRYVFNDTRGMPWNRSHALNTGVRFAKGDYILFSDIDMIFSETIVEEAISNITPFNQVFSYVYLIPEDFNDWEQLNSQCINFQVNNTGRGGFHLISKIKIDEINGFDEYYCYWGLEDLDLFNRLEKLGVKTVFLDLETIPFYHQWHPKVSSILNNFLPKDWYSQMYVYYELNFNKLKRNLDNRWGEVLCEKIRSTIYYSNNPEQFSYDVLFINVINNNHEKSKIIIDIIKKLSIMTNFEILEIRLSLESEFNNKINNFINRVLNKINFDGYIISKKQYNIFLETSYFISTLKISDAIWYIIKKTDLVSDYYIIENDQTITYLLSKSYSNEL